MMKLTLSVPLIWMLFSTAEALKCVKGLHKSNEGSSSDPRPCPSPDDRCVTLSMQGFKNNTLLGNFTKRTCAPSSVCSEGNQPFSFSVADFRMTSSLQCCSTDGCNSTDIPFPDEQKPNGLKCFTCDASRQFCSQTVQCVGIQDRCLTVNVTDGGQTFQLQGCGSANLCDGHTDMKLKALFNLGLHGDGPVFSDPKCCGTSLCNSAPAAKLSVPSLLLGLVVLSVY